MPRINYLKWMHEDAWRPVATLLLTDSHSDLSEQIINNSEISQKLMGELVPIIYEVLKTTA